MSSGSFVPLSFRDLIFLLPPFQDRVFDVSDIKVKERISQQENAYHNIRISQRISQQKRDKGQPAFRRTEESLAEFTGRHRYQEGGDLELASSWSWPS